ncbi:hypothetical protein BKA65DRAFT_593362 [Rhexocercosporidium sp. MPI-PUGE-AT-0058]|nr:hypothetical protein BKA65DRAFT_593362 [Rhexocercosporidium sp. MPI-PUGE-AT-0058]
MSVEKMSSKVKALVDDILVYQSSEKSAVFSYWTHSLDIIQFMLQNFSILHARVDGKTSLLRRQEALHSFEVDDSIRVILVSITCGGTGLSLTAASRQIIELQKRKKLLAKVMFGSDPMEESGIEMSTLQYLKSVLE